MTAIRTVCIALGLLGTAFLRAGVVVDFPSIADEKAPVVSGGTLWLGERGTSVPCYLEGKLIYFSVTGGANVAGHSIENPTFDKVKKGMTVDGIVSLLGPGTQDSRSGVGLICWKSEDARILSILHPSNIHDTAKFTIRQQGEDQRHGEVKKTR